jgi:hypothetical protein
MIRAPEWTDFDSWHTRKYVESIVYEVNRLGDENKGLRQDIVSLVAVVNQQYDMIKDIEDRLGRVAEIAYRAGSHFNLIA